MSRMFFMAIFIGGLVLPSVSLGYSGGSGTPDQPYQIATKADLLTLAGTVADYNKCFILTADIDVEGQVFTSAIIAMDGGPTYYWFDGAAFTGTFDGNSHKITNFTINNGRDYLGLFGYVGSSGSVKNLGIENCAVNSVYTSENIGGLVGENIGTISNCYSTGVVSGSSSSSYVGGLVGENYGVIINCYSTGAVSGDSDVGGLVGFNNIGSIANCYSTGSVSGSSGVGGLLGYNDDGSISNCYSTGAVNGTSYVGGLVGYNQYGSIIRSYFLLGAGPDNDCGEPLTDEQMKQQASFIGWDFINETANGTCNYWQMPQDAYPAISVFCGYIPPLLSGGGTEQDPYTVTDANDLGTIWFRPLAHYVLANDINLAGIQWSLAVVPVFSGVFDGNGFCIDNLFINGAGFLGMFGMTCPASQIKNLGLENCSVSGIYWYVGGLVGYNDSGNITDCYSTGSANSTSYSVGGLVGFNNNGSITNCYSTSIVSGDYVGGGLVGYNYYGSITNCYSTGIVSGVEYVGGLIGYNYYGSIANCYSKGSVSSAYSVGGLVGLNNNGDISNSYSMSIVSGGAGYTGGLVGYHLGGSISNCYSTGTVNSTFSAVGGLLGYIDHGSVTNSYSIGAVSGDSYIGGLVGYTDDGSITDCYSAGSVSGGTYFIGGLVGRNDDGGIINCYAAGAVSGTYYVGGLVGRNYGDIINCYSTGIVSGVEYVGGLMGDNFGNITNCYSTGIVSGVEYVGGLVGYKYGGTIVSSFWDIETSGQMTSDGGTGLNTAQMKQQASFIGWDFTTPVWTIRENLDYPHLWWEGNILYVPGRYPTIQSAIDAAVNGDTVIVAPGTYTGPGNRDIDFLGKTITVRSADPNSPNIVAATIIDCNATEEDLHRGFYFHSGEGQNSVLDGFTITNGCAHKGGAIWCRYFSSPTIINCIIRGNISPYEYVPDPFVPMVILQEGGGICCFESSPIIKKCYFIDNTATGGGGAIYSWHGNALIDTCVIKSNRAGISGGAIELFGDNMSIHNCEITGNSAGYVYPVSSGGGAICCSGFDSSTLTISNCTISGNRTDRYGGGILCADLSDVTVSNSVVWGNYALEGNEVGLRYGGFGPPSLTISYSDIHDGAIGTYIESGCTLNWGPGNIDTDPCFVEPGYWVDSNDPNIIVEPNYLNAVWLDGDYHLKSAGWRWDTQRKVWTWDDVTSRCIDAGNPGSPLGDELLFIPDDPNNEWGQNLRIDMGAFGGTAEASIPPYDWALLADLTNDGLVDLVDFAFQAADWLNSADQQPGDLNRDSFVDISDLALLVEDWLGQTTWH